MLHERVKGRDHRFIDNIVKGWEGRQAIESGRDEGIIGDRER